MNTNTNKALPLNKSRTFQLTKVPSMVDPGVAPQKRYYSPSYPRSPQLIFGEEIIHFSHPRHPLSLVNLPDRFTCAGCKEYGAGKRFVCQQCDFQLHDFCGSAPPALKAHPLHCQHQLVLFSKPVKAGGVVQSKCDVCNKSIKGYAFRCSACSFQMHPCCAMLSSEMNMPRLHPHTLRLLPANNSSNDINMVCGECSRKRSGGRVYHCTVCDYHLHALCAKNHVNGLRENGHKGNDKPNSSNMLGTAARVASQVVIEFIGGLIEGLAEGVGQVIVQDVAKGRSTTTSTATRGSSRQLNDTYY